MNKEEFVARYGEEAYAKGLSRNRTWRVAHPEERAASHAVSNAEEFRKGGKYYNKTLVYNHTGLRGERNIVRHKHGDLWRKYKNIIASDSQLQHEWFPQTADYRGVALVEKDQHMHGFIDVIRVLKGQITLFTEKGNSCTEARRI
jgi:hypothetical protein